MKPPLQLLLPFLFSSLLFIGCSGDVPIDEARRAILDGNPAEAERLLEHVLFLNPRDAGALILTSRISTLQKNWTSAFSFYDSLRASSAHHHLDLLEEICREMLLSAIDSENPELKKRAYMEFSVFPDESTIPFFRKGLSDSSGYIREICIKALSRVKDQSSRDKIGAFIRDPDPVLRSAGAAALFSFGDYEQSLPILVQGFRTASLPVQNMLLELLADVRNPEYIPALKSALGSEYPAVQIGACRQLLKMGHKNLACAFIGRDAYSRFLNDDSVAGDFCSLMFECRGEENETELTKRVMKIAELGLLPQKLFIYRCLGSHGIKIPGFNAGQFLKDDSGIVRLLAAEILYFQEQDRGTQELATLYAEGIRDMEFIFNSGDDELQSIIRSDFRNLSLIDIRSIGKFLAGNHDLSGLDMLLPFCRNADRDVALTAAGSILAIIQIFSRPSFESL